VVETLGKETGTKPVIGLAGFFGYGNYGDELFVSVYKEYLQDHFDLRFLSDQLTKPYYSKPVEEVVDGVDAIVIGGGDIVQPWNMDPRYFSKEFLKKPVFVIGVGVPIRSGTNMNPHHAEKEWIVEKYRAFFNHSSVKFIHARDPQSATWITSKTKPDIGVFEAPDVVCALTLPKATPPQDKPVLGIVTRQRPNQEDDYTQINALADQQRQRGWHIRHIILGTGEVGVRDLADAVDVTGPKEMIYSESLDDLTRAIGGCTALASMKFHGTVVATMYGVPSTVLIPTNKNRNFMNRIGRADLLSKYDDTTLCARFEMAPDSIAPESVAMLREKAKEVMTRLRDGLQAVVGG
jgi:polysaccharide pyruvyl transferase WcaK-like protein